jgi:hypothetical protein
MPISLRRKPHLVNLEGQELHIRLMSVPKNVYWQRIYPQTKNGKAQHRFNIVQYSKTGKRGTWVSQSYRLNLRMYSRSAAIGRVNTLNHATDADKEKAVRFINKYYQGRY